MKRRWWLAGLGAGAYGALSWLAHRSAFFPMKYPGGFWNQQRSLGAEDVHLTTADGVKLHSWWVPGSGPGVVLYLHGNAGNITHRSSAVRALQSMGQAVLLPDYRGYGKSEGSPSEKGLYRDADAAYQALLARGYAPEQIVLYGESLGTAVAVDLASRKPCRLLVLQAPFPSARAVAAHVLPLLGPALISGFDSDSKIGRVHVPLVVIHGDRDEVIDISLGRRLFEKANEPKQFWAVAGAMHNDVSAWGRLAPVLTGRDK